MLVGVDFPNGPTYACSHNQTIYAAMKRAVRGVIFAGRTPRRCPTNEKETIPGVAVRSEDAQTLLMRLEQKGTVAVRIAVYDAPCKEIFR